MLPISAEVPLQAFFATPQKKGVYPGLIVIQEIWGLNDHIKDVATRYANEGYIVLAPDLLSETGITEKVDQTILAEIKNPATRDEAQKKLRAIFAPVQSPEFAQSSVTKLKACVDYLLGHKQVNGNVGVLGFCFGGTYSYALAAADNRIKAAVPFYGHAPEQLDKLENIACPILAFYGEYDKNLVESLPELQESMKKFNKEFDSVVYPNCGHAFFNDTNPAMYNKDAATDAWEKSLAFLSKNLQ